MDQDIRQTVVRDGYNRLANSYAGERGHLKSGKYLEKFVGLLKPGAVVLDIGCGDGVPVDETLIKKGYLVTGIDIAQEMIKRARRNCPRGEYRLQNMEDLKPNAYRVEAVVSMYAIFHVPREKHLDLLLTMGSFLPKGGILLITMGDRDFEDYHRVYGVEMWSSQWGVRKNRQLTEQAGFAVLVDELATSGGERHQVLLGRKL